MVFFCEDDKSRFASFSCRKTGFSVISPGASRCGGGGGLNFGVLFEDLVGLGVDDVSRGIYNPSQHLRTVLGGFRDSLGSLAPPPSFPILFPRAVTTAVPGRGTFGSTTSSGGGILHSTVFYSLNPHLPPKFSGWIWVGPSPPPMRAAGRTQSSV